MRVCRCGNIFCNVKILFVLFWMNLWINLQNTFGVNANFNFYLDRREFQKLHGISSDIYYVREGVVNEYATSFLVTVPADVDDLNFSWQALTKRPVFYEMTVEYTDFFALLPPTFNVSTSGHVPQHLEVFRLSLPCSGRSNAEVTVKIRIDFKIKHPKVNTTTINIKRNKICLFKEFVEKNAGFPSVTVESDEHSLPPRQQSTNGEKPLRNDLSFFSNPTPTLLLIGLLGSCAVTASAVFLSFFICLRRRLTPQHTTALPGYSCHGDSSHGDSSCHGDSDNSTPASLLRQPAPPPAPGWKNFNSVPPLSSATKEKSGNVLPTSGSHNPYVGTGPLWTEVTNDGAEKSRVPPSGLPKCGQTLKGSDVSPYAYAHVGLLPKCGAPPLIEWYSQFPCQSGNSPLTTSSYVATSNDKIHIYNNNLQSTFSPLLNRNRNERSSGDFETENSQLENPTSTIKSATGSLIQVDGFQCKRNLAHEQNVVERFL